MWADADTWFERQQQEEETKRLKKEHDAIVANATADKNQGATEQSNDEGEPTLDPMAAAEEEALQG